MTITITVDENLKNKAKVHQLSVEQFALSILTQAIEESESITPEEVVKRIQATPPNPSQIRPATADLAELLCAAPCDPSFDLVSWNRQWAAVEAEMKGITRANDAAEGRAG